jgi:pyrroloquinoline quinone (PQQ) biosynthesis protein C
VTETSFANWFTERLNLRRNDVKEAYRIVLESDDYLKCRLIAGTIFNSIDSNLTYELTKDYINQFFAEIDSADKNLFLEKLEKASAAINVNEFVDLVCKRTEIDS